MKDFSVFLEKEDVSVLISYEFDANDEMNVSMALNHSITDFSKTEIVGYLLRFANAHQFDILKWFADNGWNTTSYYDDIKIQIFGESVFCTTEQKVVEFKTNPTLLWSDHIEG